jgi:two-component system cell cycle sensor histidine kinase/response regulator CckA
VNDAAAEIETNPKGFLAPTETELIRTGGTILLVEDEAFVREVVGEILRSAGYRVLKARQAAEAMRVFRRHRQEVGLLITDVVMPGRNGRDLARDLSSICPGLITIFVSGYPETVLTKDGALERGVFYLPKPFSAGDLLQQVRHVLQDDRTTSVPKII